jgi:hypothetical protein
VTARKTIVLESIPELRVRISPFEDHLDDAAEAVLIVALRAQETDLKSLIEAGFEAVGVAGCLMEQPQADRIRLAHTRSSITSATDFRIPVMNGTSSLA